jgi:ubiquinone/menaquinone biosynthesis C-methylase UbiE
MSLREWRDVWRRAHGRGTYPHQLAFLLDVPLRRLVLSPRQLAERLHLREDSRVLELGPGPGFFSVEIARRLPRGRLVLFDLQREMLLKAGRKLERAHLCNTLRTQGDARALPYRDATFDVVVLVAVIGEVPDPPACLREIRRVLRPGALLSVTEQPGDPDFTPLPELQTMAEAVGFQLAESFGKGRNFTANFRKPVA